MNAIGFILKTHFYSVLVAMPLALAIGSLFKAVWYQPIGILSLSPYPLFLPLLY
jgi:hypothetical protein